MHAEAWEFSVVLVIIIILRKYPIMRRTQNMQIPYYVKENFHTEYQGSVKRLEMSVEEEYVSNLRHQCYREKSYSKCFFFIFYIILLKITRLFNTLKELFHVQDKFNILPG